MRISSIFFCLTSAVLLSGCVGDSNTTIEPATVAPDSPNSFLTYPNTQASLSAGKYDIVVGTTTAGTGAPGGVASAYQLTITYDDGRMQTIKDVWPATGSSGPAATATGNGHEALVLDHAGGVTISMSSLVSGYLFLVRNGSIVASDSSSGAGGTPLINLPVTQISSVAYGQAYYKAVDPNSDRDTIEKWKIRNGFYGSNSTITHVVFRDALDLGYGRDMYVIKNSTTGRLAFFVQNFVVELQPGSSSNYGPLNVDAAISQDQRYLQGINAIEFSPANEDNLADQNGSMNITKFFTFDKNGNRITTANLDGRGYKHMPGMCWACHGGQTLPLDESGKFQPQSLRSAKFNILGVSDFEYSLQDGYHRDQLEPAFKIINSYVAGSYADMKARSISDPATKQGKWSADYAQELVAGRYNGGTSSTYVDDFVPAGWQEGSGRPVGVSQLFKEVVGPHCTACHSLQGRAATYEPGVDAATNLGNAVNFSSYEKFIAYRSRIIDYVYRRGIMPLSLRNFEKFWKNPDREPALLASFLSDPSLFDSSGHVVQPGYPVARPGTNRSVKSLPAAIDGNASYFADSWQWTIKSQPTQPTGTSVSLLNANTARPQLVVVGTPANGDYQFELTVANSKGSNTGSVVLTVNSALAKTSDQLTFVNDIRPIFSSYGCTNCHSSTGINGIPVYWTDEVDSNGVKLYQRVLARVDRNDPEGSRLLFKPTGYTHGGGLLIDTSTSSGKADYDTILNWIREGAVCGNQGVLNLGCPQ